MIPTLVPGPRILAHVHPTHGTGGGLVLYPRVCHDVREAAPAHQVPVGALPGTNQNMKISEIIVFLTAFFLTNYFF